MGEKRTRDEEAERKNHDEGERSEQSRQASETESEAQSLRAVITVWDTTTARLQRSVSDAQRERDEALDRAAPSAPSSRASSTGHSAAPVVPSLTVRTEVHSATTVPPVLPTTTAQTASAHPPLFSIIDHFLRYSKL